MLTSDKRRKTVLVLVHSFMPPKRASLGVRLYISPLRYSEKLALSSDGKISMLGHVLSTWSKLLMMIRAYF